MPRDGSGSSDNAIETGNEIIHGAGKEEVRTPFDVVCFSPNGILLPSVPVFLFETHTLAHTSFGKNL
jgi:hypothetical protein